jgi:hypothetical protein
MLLRQQLQLLPQGCSSVAGGTLTHVRQDAAGGLVILCNSLLHKVFTAAIAGAAALPVRGARSVLRPPLPYGSVRDLSQGPDKRLPARTRNGILGGILSMHSPTASQCVSQADLLPQ